MGLEWCLGEQNDTARALGRSPGRKLDRISAVIVDSVLKDEPIVERISLDANLLLGVIFVGWRGKDVNFAIHCIFDRVIIWPERSQWLLGSYPKPVTAIGVEFIAAGPARFGIVNGKHVRATGKTKEEDSGSNFKGHDHFDVIANDLGIALPTTVRH
jgi:hypothetical protein